MNDATYLASLLEKNKISRKELIDDVICRIKKSNKYLNALVDFDEDKYRERYLNVNDTKLEDTIFKGIPVPLKILGQSKYGFADTSASRLFKYNTATRTNNFVKKMEHLGLVPVGKTNAPEFGFKNVTDSKLYGDSHNPWNLDFSSGGSSGGAASAVASGMFPLAGASDGGGSIRIPASFTGLIGLKPTRGTMPVGPGGYRGWQGASIDFALNVSMRDTIKLFYGMRGITSVSPFQAPRVEWSGEVTKSKLKVAYSFESPLGTSISEDAKFAMLKALQVLEDAGFEVVPIKYPLNGISLMDSYYKMNAAETAKMFCSISSAMNRKMTQDDMELMTWGLYRYGLNISAVEYSQCFDEWDKATEIMEDIIFSNFDLFMTPTTAYTAPNLKTDLQSDKIREDLMNVDEFSKGRQSEIIYDMFYESLKLTPFTQLANLTGEPAISLPIWIGKNNLPLGIQFMSAKGREDMLFRIGELFENTKALELPKYYR
ncbi:amidase [Companilactobacillus insicii]|uniref:amidase n=1 Tax=Companilactobacillus insicii TaxID=1732567 RepID=UPI000F7A749A|nr:amidase [Companilactobacillus insicii]